MFRNTNDFDYDLPAELIAQQPVPTRDESRLMVLDAGVTHRIFRELPDLLQSGDLLVLNETRVIAARLLGRRVPGGGRVELLLLHPAGSARYDAAARTWIALTKPARRLHHGDRVRFDSLGEAVVREVLDEGMREIEFRLDVPFESFLERAGRMPLPPYIHNQTFEAQQRYQTVFARVAGSVAAPTASLHFTANLLQAIQRRGTEIARLSLDIGLGTFRPVTVASVDDHVMHGEPYAIEPAAAAAIERARNDGRRIVAAGTTVVRALEANFASFGRIEAGEHVAELFIRPGFRFAVVGAMITNFHLPRSTLLMLVSAFAGRDRVLRAYGEAIAQRYRFYSFGDAMFIAGSKG
ncbi:MAG: tRNA preQ1(34) S-adenosylmethionine ribosyltransferase-isomerase QueA [Candidatus Eremiobacteraeota bacterium]|nr:tRNA preQ1(34) S-adenosylmethionine ribosyltransferase-isomerase QueA [Candidatus Eremiobacteraeota bacterium]